MKRLSLVFFFVLMLCVFGVAAGEEACTEHGAACTNPGVCVACGYVDDSMGIWATYCDFSVWAYYDQDYCASACSKCGTYWAGTPELDKWEHVRYCNTNYCSYCGSTDCNFLVTHPDPESFTMEDMGDTHGYKCPDCGGYDEQSIDAHEAACTALDVCRYCGHANPENVWHTGSDRTWHDLGSTHAYYCNDCQSYINEAAHVADCTAPTTCTVCGATGIEATLNHSGSTEWQSDGDTHSQRWSCCGATGLSGENHFVWCDDETQSVCCLCGAESTNIDLWHRVDSTWQNDGDTHSLVYTCCDTVAMSGQAHFTWCDSEDTSKCANCGADTNVDLWHRDEVAFRNDGDTHTSYYPCCGTVNFEGANHLVYCDDADLTACRCCGATGVNIDLWHQVESTWQNDGDTHSQVYTCCNTVVTEGQSHYANCMTPNTCRICGAEDVEAQLEHGEGADWYDETQHWHGCADCKEPFGEKEAHFSFCSQDDTTVCYSCGATVDAANISFSHDFDDSSNWGYDDNVHWQNCWCGEISADAQYEHQRDCTMTACYCGYTGENVVVSHFYGSDSGYEHDSASHWKTCSQCGDTEAQKGSHSAVCTAPNKCVYCGAEGITATVRHNSEYKVWSDETYHWNGCVDCGNPVGEKDTHHVLCDRTDRSVCSICGVAVDPDTVGIGHVELGLTEWEYDADTHWKQFCVCGEMVDWDVHWLSCDAPDAGCAVCGYADGSMPIYHAFGSAEYIDGAYHQEYCARCGDSQQGMHWSMSCLSNICEGCGAEFDNTDPNHSWTDDTMEYDASGHWYTCIECGETVEKADHWYSCAAPDTCANCGYVSSVSTKYDHYWTTVYESDNPDYHYKYCITCGGEYDIASHTVSCANPGVCTGCGATGITVDEIKHGNVTWEHNDTKHWGVCGTCNETLEEGLHWTDCSKPNLCQDCGATGVTIDPSILSHFDVSWGIYEHDDTHHWYICRTCNIKAFYAEHAVKCSSKGVCTECGVVGDFAVQHEALKSGWESDATDHWKVCAVCEDTANKAAHADENKDDKCDTCQAALAHTHSWGEPVTVEATCTADGSTTTACANCGEKTVETIVSTGHAWGEPVTVEATCTADGSKTTTCTACGEENVETIASTGHAWGEPVTVDATCTADGSKTTACANCDEKTVETIASTGHAWGEPVTVDATCTADGSKTTACANCDEKTVETIASTGHAWGEPVTVAATCTADGSKTTACANCGEKTVETIKSTGHAWGEPVIVAATCTADGSKTTSCANCTEKTVETIASTGHAWGEPVIVDATCTADGSKTTACANCGEKTVEVIPSLGGHKWKTAENVAATCTTDGRVKKICSVCNTYTVSTSAAKGHAWGEPVIVAATCTTDGSKTIACANCDEKTVETIAATGHAWGEPVTVAATCTADGSKTTTCANCGEQTVENVAAKGHAYGLVYTTQNNGTHAKFCTDCGAIQTAKCTMATTQLGSMTCSACATCGYTVYTFNEAEGNEEQAAAEAETTDEAESADSTETVAETESSVTAEEAEAPQTVTEAKAETVVKRVENVSFEIVAPVVPKTAETEAAAEETESAESAASAESEEEAAAEEAAEEPEPVDYSDVVLVVHETNVEMDVELPDTVTAEVKKVLAVSMLKEGTSIQPAAAVKLSIPVAEEEVTGLKLVLMMEDGQLVELEYEIIDGVIVFETDIVGVFLFVDAVTVGA